MFEDLYEFVRCKEPKLDERNSYFLGDCRNIVDPEDTEKVSELQGVVTEGRKITKEEFLKVVDIEKEHLEMINSNPNNFEYYRNDNESIHMAWFYDVNNDVEYFYGIK